MPTLERVHDAVELPDELPTVALRDLVFFPYMVLPLLIGREPSVAALDQVQQPEGLLVVLAQKDAEEDAPGADDLHPTGTVVKVLESSALPDGTRRVVLEGVGRVRAHEVAVGDGGVLRARVMPLREREADDDPSPSKEASEGDEAGGSQADPEETALVRRVRRSFEEYVRLHPDLSEDLLSNLEGVEDRIRTLHLVAGHIVAPAEDKQGILDTVDPGGMARSLDQLLQREIEVLRVEERIDREMHRQMDSDRRQVYLEEQLRAIRKELGTEEGEWAELEAQLKAAQLPDDVRRRSEAEFERLRKLNPAAPEAGVIRTHLEWLLALPWENRTEDNLDVANAEEVLDEDHHGLEEVKERILDYIAVLSLVGELKGPVLCLAGPPGVGKTSLGRSIARALDRRFIRISLGGIRDEAEIRGHRRTYVGALPGRIIQGIRRAGTRNPVLLLDEVDKLASDAHGDPAAALLEVLDPEQNREFTDHFLEVEFDLSDVLFLATANGLAGIPGPLQDRMEVIRIPGYLDAEKRAIAKNFLVPRQMERHGLSPRIVGVAPEAVDTMIQRYTREAGVRELDRQISRVARKVARSVATGEVPAEKATTVRPEDLRRLLGPPPWSSDGSSEGDARRVGIANGLAWTDAGGEILDVEVAVVPGSGRMELTGALGDIMKESATAALTYARSRAHALGLPEDFHESVDIHIHIPEGATPKDGPSAGITMATALISALTGRPTREDVALTGEITLRGRVLQVGGIREKAVAAIRHRIRHVVIPQGNLEGLAALPQELTDPIEFRPVSSMDEVLQEALAEEPDRGEGAQEAAASPRATGSLGGAT